MIRKLLLIVVIMHLLFLLGCQLRNEDSGQEAISEMTIEDQMVTPENYGSDSEANVLGPITINSEEVAIGLCRTVLGTTDEETGFKLSYLFEKEIEINGDNYFVMKVRWLVDNNHWSYIGEVMVSVNSGEIYAASTDREGNYFLWERLS